MISNKDNNHLTSHDDEFGCFAPIQRKIQLIEGKNNGRIHVGKTHSNHVILIRNCKDTYIFIPQNQRLATVFVINCKDCRINILDSTVFSTRSLRVIGCSGVKIFLECVDVRKVECWSTVDSIIEYGSSPTVTSNVRIIWREGCNNNKVRLVETTNNQPIRESNVSPSTGSMQFLSYFDWSEDIHTEMLRDGDGVPVPEAMARVEQLERFLLRVLPCDKIKENFPAEETILEGLQILENTPFNINEKKLHILYDKERKEYTEEQSELKTKIKTVASYIKNAKHVVIYTGAGISTSANIPDFRGPQGMWTLRDKGQHLSKGLAMDEAHPTYAHYAITELVREGLVHFVVSTNMDCLHIRSGLPKHLISEQHGNSNKEICINCKLEHYRSYDVTDTVLHYRDHYTFRNCKWCGGMLKDTIVHFSENLREEDVILSLHHARKADLAIVMGTSMNVQPNATFPDKCLQKSNGKLVIVNLQKTPYDNIASSRLYCTTDTFMELLMEELGLTEFDMKSDCKSEWDTITEEELAECYQKSCELQMSGRIFNI